ncbi:hypothetical protein EYF80_035484 [Liparis tanakae]|uniref:Uncharacterized protein n=1 Tax=Liparis tanakae TaxID=230148 RepID=A0A4Z2GNK7_9TELE|nr:hypothetical protein EYF80_035484 [Liparis tanakae]
MAAPELAPASDARGAKCKQTTAKGLKDISGEQWQRGALSAVGGSYSAIQEAVHERRGSKSGNNQLNSFLQGRVVDGAEGERHRGQRITGNVKIVTRPESITASNTLLLSAGRVFVVKQVMISVLPSALRVSSRAAANTAHQSGGPAILQRRLNRNWDRNWARTGPASCDPELSGQLIVRVLIKVFNPQQESREVGGRK